MINIGSLDFEPPTSTVQKRESSARSNTQLHSDIDSTKPPVLIRKF
jgi:hypothetical protein